MPPPTILVIGATGRCGRHTVRALLERLDSSSERGSGPDAACKAPAEENYGIRLLVRSTAKLAEALSKPHAVRFQDARSVFVGDVRDADSLRASGVFRGAEVIIYCVGREFKVTTPKEVDYEGFMNVVDVAKESGTVKHFIMISSAAVTPHAYYSLPGIILNYIGNYVLAYKFKAEQALRRSGLPYTIVRPGGLNDAPLTRAAVFQGDKVLGEVTLPVVGDACASLALDGPVRPRLTVELMSDPPFRHGQAKQGALPAPHGYKVRSAFDNVADSLISDPWPTENLLEDPVVSAQRALRNVKIVLALSGFALCVGVFFGGRWIAKKVFA